MIKRKLLEINRVNEVWNKYIANKIKLTIIKSENNWMKLKFIIQLELLDFYNEDILDSNPFLFNYQIKKKEEEEEVWFP